MAVDHGRGFDGGDNLEYGDANANCPPQISVILIQKGAFCGLQNTPKSVSSRSSAPDAAPPDPLVGWRGDTPPNIPPHLALTHIWRLPFVPRPEFHPDLHLWLYNFHTAINSALIIVTRNASNSNYTDTAAVDHVLSIFKSGNSSAESLTCDKVT